MGIEQFFSSLEANTINSKHKFTYKSSKPIKGPNLFIDFNSIVYITSSAIVNDLNYLVYNNIYKKPIDDKVKQILADYNLSKVSDVDKLNINQIVLDKIVEYIKFIVTQLTDANTLDLIYIAIDGVPNKNKMIEQRKRRYMAAIINEYKKELFDKYSDDLDNNRYHYETSKIYWSKNNITPGTEFMLQLNLLLQSSRFELLLKQLCPNLTKYIYNGPYIFGEGEKKIMDYIYTHLSDNYIIYSPDSDMTILSLALLSHHNCNIKLLRHNQQQNDYDIIDINALSHNIMTFVNSVDSNHGLEESVIIRDLSFIMTIFGNDYIPKIESFDVKYDFLLMVRAYIDVIIRENRSLISRNLDKYVLNDFILKHIIIELSSHEESHLQRKYLISNYSNYQNIKKDLGAIDDNFIDKLKYAITDPNILSKLTNLNVDLVDKSIKANKLVILKKNALSLDNEKYYDRFKKQNFDTVYDRELFKLDNMLDQYTTYFNAQLTDISKISVINQNSKLNLYIEPFIESTKRYYTTKFHGTDIKTVVRKYLEGLVWVFNYYFNDYKLINKPNLWYYEYDHAPLLTSITKHFLDNDIKKFSDYDYETNIKLYFNPFEHFVYVSPLRLLNLPDYIKKYERFVPDIKKKLTSGKLINCNNALYLTKCHVTIFIQKSWIESHKDDIKFLDTVRKVRANYEIAQLIGDSSDKIFIADYHDTVLLSEL